MPSLSIPTNPFTAGSPEQVDFDIWAAGIDQFNTHPYIKAQNPPPHELDYLRGFHRLSVLQLIQAYLLGSLGASAIRVTSLWLDKFAYVHPYVTQFSKRRELADLAVIVRVNNQASWMWLLQAKKTMLKYALVLAIDIGADFATTFEHWSFLSLLTDPRAFVGTNPCQWMWPAPLANGSFSGELLQLCLKATGQVQQSKGQDASATSPHTEWRRLHDELQHAVVATPQSGHARGATSITAFLEHAQGVDDPLRWLAEDEPYISRLFTPDEGRGADWQLLSTGFATGPNGWLNAIPAYRALNTEELIAARADGHSYERPAPWPDSKRDRDSSPDVERESTFDGGNGGDGAGNWSNDGGNGGGVPVTLIVDVIGAGAERLD